MRATDTRMLFLVVFSTFAATALEGMIIDSDHWRHSLLVPDGDHLGLSWRQQRWMIRSLHAVRRVSSGRSHASPRGARAARQASSAPWRSPEPAQPISRRWLSKERPGKDAVFRWVWSGVLGLHDAKPRAQRELRLCDARQAAAVDQWRLADDRRALGVDVDDATRARRRGRQHASVAADRHRAQCSRQDRRPAASPAR